MVIGAFVGAGIWALLEPMAPGMSASPAPFVVVGMIACFGSIAHAWLAVMLMVAEMTGSLALLAPAMIALGMAAIIVGDHTIYTAQLRNRVESPTHRLRFGVPLLASVRVGDVMSQPKLVLSAQSPTSAALDQLEAARVPGAPVIDAARTFRGVVDAEQLRSRLEEDGECPVADMTEAEWPAIAVEASLDDALDTLATNERTWISVLDGDKHVVGIVGMTELIAGYREALLGALRRLGSAAKEAVLVEEVVAEGSPIARRTVSELDWPIGTVVVSIQRDSQLVFPEGDTTIEPEDRVSVLTRPDNATKLKAFLRGGAVDEDGGDAQSPDLI
jgi:CBS domain-containing protein